MAYGDQPKAPEAKKQTVEERLAELEEQIMKLSAEREKIRGKGEL